MKKLSKVIMSMVMVTVLLGIMAITAGAASTNLMPGTAGTFESTSIPTGWTKVGSTTTLALSTEEKHGGQKSLSLTDRSATYNSPAYSLTSVLKANGAGTYSVSMWVCVDGLNAEATAAVVIRCSTADYTFITDAANKRALLGTVKIKDNFTWTQIKGTVTIEEEDLEAATDADMRLCIDSIPADVTTMYIDDVVVEKETGGDGTTAGSGTTTAPTTTQAPDNSEGTADMASIGYAITAILSLGGIAISRKRFGK